MVLLLESEGRPPEWGACNVRSGTQSMLGGTVDGFVPLRVHPRWVHGHLNGYLSRFYVRCLRDDGLGLVVEGHLNSPDGNDATEASAGALCFLAPTELIGGGLGWPRCIRSAFGWLLCVVRMHRKWLRRWIQLWPLWDPRSAHTHGGGRGSG